MPTHTKFSSLEKSTLWLAAATLALAASLSSARAADPATDGEHGEKWAQQRQQWVHAKLAREASRLEITASQQAAWGEYAQARSALAERTFAKPAPDADATTVAKVRADRAADGARKLAALAEATAKLEAVLAPEQRKTLDQIVRADLRRHRGLDHRDGRHDRQGEHGDGYAPVDEHGAAGRPPA